MTIRPAAVAGTFYPGNAADLASAVSECLANARGAVPAVAPKAIIAPHAGYVYSGPIAANAYALLAPLAGRVCRVVLAGPAHRVYVRGLAVPSTTAFTTPLGTVPLDVAAIESIRGMPGVEVSDAAHAREHSLEVQLPFLQAVLGEFKLVPLVVGDMTPAAMAAVFEKLWGGDETLVVVSSDLSHYLPYEAARARDGATARSILDLQATLDPEDACGAAPVNGLLELARRRGLTPRLLDLRNSGDTAGDRDRVVGYAAFAFDEPRAR